MQWQVDGLHYRIPQLASMWVKSIYIAIPQCALHMPVIKVLF